MCDASTQDKGRRAIASVIALTPSIPNWRSRWELMGGLGRSRRIGSFTSTKVGEFLKSNRANWQIFILFFKVGWGKLTATSGHGRAIAWENTVFLNFYARLAFEI
jgi:hypothetical protein